MPFAPLFYHFTDNSRAYTSFLPDAVPIAFQRAVLKCQCPLGLIPHFYKNISEDASLSKIRCQCPLGLIPHFYAEDDDDDDLSEFRVSMPSRAYTSFLRYPFKNLGFMRFPEPVFAGIYQNILTTAVLRAC